MAPGCSKGQYYVILYFNSFMERKLPDILRFQDLSHFYL